MIDFGATNSARYYSLENGLTLGANDWTILMPLRYRLDTANPQYLVSTGTINTANSLNILAGGTTGALGFAYNTQAAVYLSNIPTNNADLLLCLRRTSGSIRLSQLIYGGSISHTTTVTPSAASSSSTLIVGGRSDLSTTRFWRSHLGAFIVLPSYSMSDAELQELSDGMPLLSSSIIQQSGVRLWEFDSPHATIQSIVSDETATRNGTSYPSASNDLFLVHPPAPITVHNASVPPMTTKGVRVTLHAKAGGSRPNLTNLHVAFFDQNAVGSLLAPVFKTTTGTTNSSGILEINVDADTSLAIGARGLITVCNPHPTDYKLNQYYISEAEIIGIA